MYRNRQPRKDEIVKNKCWQGIGPRWNFISDARARMQSGFQQLAIAGSHTAPLLSSDMHLEYSLPGIWYMTHLEAPGLNVAGVALPGAPGIVVGHNQRIAWGITNLHFDVQDLYNENLDERTGRYLFRGQVEQARGEREVIRIKGAADVEVTNWIRATARSSADGNSAWVQVGPPAERGMLQYPFIDINRAQNWREFTAAIGRLPGPGSNFVYADVDGNIGYHAAGALPRRRNYRGDIPVDGASGNFEWDGYIPFDELPSVYNPPSGLIVSANQNTFPENFAYPLNGNFAAPFRAQQIARCLPPQRRPRRTCWRYRKCFTLSSAISCWPTAGAYQKRNAHNPDLDGAVELLRGWNGQMDKDLAAPFLITLAFQHVRRAVAENASPAAGMAYEFSMASVAIERLLTERPAGWFADYDEMLLRALADAVEEGRRIQGRDPKHWRYGDYLRVAINNRCCMRCRGWESISISAGAHERV